MDQDLPVTVVDRGDVELGSASRADVLRDMLYHRRSVVLAKDSNDRWLLRKIATPNPRLDVTAATLELAGETGIQAAVRALAELGLDLLSPPRLAGRASACWETDFAHVSVFMAEVASTDHAAWTVLETADLARWAAKAESTLTYQLCYGLWSLPEVKTQEGLHATLDRAIEAFFDSAENRITLKHYEVSPSQPEDAVSLIAEIDGRLRGSQASWLGEILSIFDNARPYYPAPAGLEVGELLLGHHEIVLGLRKMANEVANSVRHVRLVAKLESGRWMTSLLEAELGACGCTTELLEVRTRWRGHGDATVTRGLARRLRPGLTLVCDTMISTGATFGAIRALLSELNIRDDIESAVLLSVDRTRHHTPERIRAVKRMDGHDWTVGFGSDASICGVSSGRAIPFLCALKPVGLGVRAELLSKYAQRGVAT